MEHFTQFYTDNETGQPVRFMIHKYDIDFLNEHIRVFYKKETFNMAQDKVIAIEQKEYLVTDEVIKVDFLNQTPEEITEPLKTAFSDWVQYVPDGVARMIDIFVGSTISHIELIEGVS